MNPRIMTWCQHGEAPLHYMQQVRKGGGAQRGGGRKGGDGGGG
jgi:hypothetical protein